MMDTLDSIIQIINADIYISGQLLPGQLEAALKMNVASVLSLRCSHESGFRVSEKQEVEDVGKIYIHIPFSSEMLEDKQVTEILDQIVSLPKPVLISCRTAFRSSFIALLYIATRSSGKVLEAQKLKHQLGIDFSSKQPFQIFFDRFLIQKI